MGSTASGLPSRRRRIRDSCHSIMASPMAVPARLRFEDAATSASGVGAAVSAPVSDGMKLGMRGASASTYGTSGSMGPKSGSPGPAGVAGGGGAWVGATGRPHIGAAAVRVMAARATRGPVG